MALSTVTLGTLRDDLRSRLPEANRDVLLDTELNRFLNLGQYDAALKLSGINAIWYGDVAQVSPVTGGGVVTYDSSVKWDAGDKLLSSFTFTGTHGDYVGGIVAYADVREEKGYVGVITTTTATTCKVEGAMPTGDVDAADGVGIFIQPSKTGGASQVVDLSNVSIMRIIKLVDATNGIIPFYELKDFEQLGKNYNWDSGYGATHFGENIYLFKGDNATAFGNLYLYYYTLPTQMTSDSSYMDVPTEFQELVLAFAELKALRRLGVGVETKELELAQMMKDIQVAHANEYRLEKMDERGKDQ